MVKGALERLEKLVGDTAQALRRGELAAIGELAKQTEAALADLGGETEGERIEALRDMARKNALALEAAGRGVRAARRRLAEIVSARSGVQTYDNAGKKQRIGGPSGAIKARL
jgi:flagellar biosynthesis/type III secretory pathway chaperone